jgi:hypothetical protein
MTCCAPASRHWRAFAASYHSSDSSIWTSPWWAAADLLDGGHRGAGHHRDERRPGLEGHLRKQLSGLGDPDVRKDFLVRKQRANFAHGAQTLGEDEDGAALDDVDLGRRALQRSEGAWQVGLVERDLEPRPRHDRAPLPTSRAGRSREDR